MLASKSQSPQGFTLVELLVALTILGFGLLAVASLLLTAVTMNALGRSTNDAMAQARDKIETLKTLPESDAQRNIGGSLTSDVTGYFDTVGNFKRRWVIATAPASMKTYSVTAIPLVSDARRNKTATLTTIF
jgi:prepilin-type N-terminal cleavage/methylation domain-containing protein